MLVRKHGTTKPRAGAQVNWSHPLSQNLLFASLFNEGSGQAIYNAAFPRLPLVVNNTTPYWTNNGLRFTGAAGSYIKTAAGYGPALANKPYTISFIVDSVTPNAGGNCGLLAVGTQASDDKQIVIRITSSTAVLFAMFNDDLTATGIPSMTGRSVQVTCTLSAQKLQTVYIDGVRIGSRTAAAMFSGDSGIAISTMGSDTGTTAATFQNLFAWDRCFSAGEVADLAANQYAPFSLPPPQRLSLFFIPPVIQAPVDGWASLYPDRLVRLAPNPDLHATLPERLDLTPGVVHTLLTTWEGVNPQPGPRTSRIMAALTIPVEAPLARVIVVPPLITTWEGVNPGPAPRTSRIMAALTVPVEAPLALIPPVQGYVSSFTSYFDLPSVMVRPTRNGHMLQVETPWISGEVPPVQETATTNPVRSNPGRHASRTPRTLRRLIK